MSSRERRATSDDAQQTKVSVPYPARRTATVPQESKHQTAGANAKSRTQVDAGTSRPVAQKFVNPREGGLRSERETRHPSSLPRSTTSQSHSRLDAIAASRPPPSSAATSRMKSEVHRPSIGAYEKEPTTNMLRRKTPSVEQYTAHEPYGSNTQTPPPPLLSQSSQYGSGHGPDRDAMSEITRPQTHKPPTMSISTSSTYSQARPAELLPSLIPEMQALAAASELNQAQIIPTAPVMSSPSSLYSESPDPWSSRGTTPTSMSSYSPGILHPHKLNPSVRRLNNTSSQQREIKSRRGEPQWTEVPKLPAVQETATASSRSTTKEPVTPKAKAEKLKKKKTPSPAPTPPPRKSSAKFRSPATSEGEQDVSRATVDPPHHAAYENPADSPLRKRNAGTVEYIGQSLDGPSTRMDPRTHEPFAAQPPRYPRWEQTSETGGQVLPTGHGDSDYFRDWSRRRSRSPQPPVSHNQQPSDNTVFAQSADQPWAHSAPRAPVVHPSHATATREAQGPAPDMNIPNPGGRRRAPSASASDSEKNTKSTPRSGFSKISTFFSRRARSDSTEATKDNVVRPSRKGPAAGTGHEGYRKHGFRTRKMSAESTTSNDSRLVSDGNLIPRPSTGRKDSGSSHRYSRNSKEDPAAEQFVAQRLEPVVILGGGGYRNRPERDAPTPWPTSDDGLASHRAGHDGRGRQTTEALAAAASRSAPVVHRPAHSDDAGPSQSQGVATSLAMRTMANPSLAARRSFTEAQGYGDANSSGHIPAPIQTEGLALVPAPESYTTSQSSLPYTSATLPPVDSEMHKVDARHLKRPNKKGRSLKWNFFHRGHHADTSTKVAAPPARQVVAVPVTITNNPNPRSLPYYAVMDSETDMEHPETLGDFLAQAVDSPSLDQMRHPDSSGPETQRRHGNSVLLPSLPPLRTGFDGPAQPASPRVHLHHEDVRGQDHVQSSATTRPRLAQVGRIPRVISRKDHHHVPPVESYSRPFSRGRIEQVPALGTSTSAAEAERPVLGIQTDVLPSRPFDDYDSAKPASAPARALTLHDPGDGRAEPEFLTFAARHDSEVSISPESEGIMSVAGPSHVFPVHHHGEEEVWKEYDELIDRVLSPAEDRKTRSLGGSSLTATSRALGGRRKGQARKDVGTRAVSAPTITPAVVESAPWPPSNRGSGASSEDMRLRRSRIVSALHSPFSPPSPFSLTDLVAEYAERNRISAQLPRRTSEAIKAETAHLASLTYDGPPDFPSLVPSHHQSTFLLDVAERDHEGPAAQSELHFAALMTSKWLSFGRVLFSPAHQEVETLPQQHVLVIDGLRNTDWSFYCALTYPSAVVHDLRESDLPPHVQQSSRTAPGRAPLNYRRVEQSSLAERFPFPTSFFTVVVLRFPPAMSDAILKLMISECKRVLMPGGHLEFMVMDIDMVNMGPHTRRAVKDLKVRMTQADPDVSLKPASDNIQNVLGRKGFERLNRCIVGIPVAGKVAGSMDSSSSSSSSSRSSHGSYTQTAVDSARGPAATARAGRPTRHHEQNTNFSLSDLIADHSPTSDEKITKMVAKVGRYWFLRSFEAAVLPDGDLTKSIWADKKVLRECKSRGSGFKLWIAYAQKPVENRRRTVSEPSLPTLATAGMPAMARTR